MDQGVDGARLADRAGGADGFATRSRCCRCGGRSSSVGKNTVVSTRRRGPAGVTTAGVPGGIGHSAYRPARPVRVTTVTGSVLIMAVARFPVALLSSVRLAIAAPWPRRCKSLMPSANSAQRGRRIDDPVSPAAFASVRITAIDLVPTPAKDQTMLVGRHLEHEAAERLLARETYMHALDAALITGGPGHGRSVLEIAEAARAAPTPRGSPGPADLLLDGLATT